jgi:hypothetical protein
MVTQEFEGTLDQYDRVDEKLDRQTNPVEGLIAHGAADIGGGKIRVVDFWQSHDQYENFVQGRLGPAIAEALGDEASEPRIEIHELHDVIPS